MRARVFILVCVCGLGASAAFAPALPLAPSARVRGTTQLASRPPVLAGLSVTRRSLPLRASPARAKHALRLSASVDGDLIVEDGDVVGVFYKGTLDDGSVFDENPGGPPLEFEVGSGRVIAGFDQAVRGLKVNESRTVRCEPENAYGQVDPSNLAEVPKEQMPTPPEGMSLEVGMVLQLTTGQIAVVKEIKDDSVVLDGNHPLAGKTLNFEVTVNYVADREQVVQDKLKEMSTILSNPLFALLAKEVTSDDKYVEKIKEKLDKADDKRTVIMDIVRQEEWKAITTAVMTNPQLQQMMQDPEAMEKILNGKKQAEEMSAAQASASSKVPEAEFETDA